MKKWLLVLGMITCMLGLTACGGTEETKAPLMSEEEAEAWAVYQVIEPVNECMIQQAEDQIADPLFLSAVESWEKASEDMGNYLGVISTEADLDAEGGVVNVTVEGSERNAVVEIVIKKQMVTSITTNVQYGFGETMKKAGLNTLLGMGTVFIVLILISLIISCFGVIPKLQAKFAGKSSKETVTKAAVEKTVAQIAEKEELSDDTELVAVIAAAIAAYEGTASTDGFVVRSIRRVRR